MKSIVAIIILFSNLSVFAESKSSEANIFGWKSAWGNHQVDTYFDLESETAFNYFNGDDGIECDGKIGNVRVVDTMGYGFEVRYQGNQDVAPMCIYEYTFLCKAMFKYVLPKYAHHSPWKIKELKCWMDWETEPPYSLKK